MINVTKSRFLQIKINILFKVGEQLQLRFEKSADLLLKSLNYFQFRKSRIFPIFSPYFQFFPIPIFSDVIFLMHLLADNIRHPSLIMLMQYIIIITSILIIYSI